MKKKSLNLIIDAMLLLCLGAISGIGILMKHVLVPGFMRHEIYGRNVDLMHWGLDRHQWGTIHFLISLTFLVLTLLHIILHWGMIAGIYRNLVSNRILWWVIAIIFIAVTIILLVFPYFVQPEIIESAGHGH